MKKISELYDFVISHRVLMEPTTFFLFERFLRIQKEKWGGDFLLEEIRKNELKDLLALADLPITDQVEQEYLAKSLDIEEIGAFGRLIKQVLKQ